MSPIGDIFLSLEGDKMNDLIKSKPKTQRNKAETKLRLINAVGEILAAKGFANVGVNAIARQAGVDKVLIYRYFDGLDGLILAYAKEGDFWPSHDELLGSEDQKAELLKLSPDQQFNIVIERYAHAICSRPLTLEILAWEMIERNSLTITLEKVRESSGMALMAMLNDSSAAQNSQSGVDLQHASTIFSAAIHYLAMRARKIKYFNGIDLSSQDEWQGLLKTMQALVSSAAQSTKG